MNSQTTISQRHQFAKRDCVCTVCGHRYIGDSSCPSCKGFGKSDGDAEIVRKTFDESDLKKGLR